MFSRCDELEYIGDISSWDLNNVISMSDMFHGCKNLTDIGDLSNLKLTTRGGDASVGASFSVSSKRMKNLKIGDADANKVKATLGGIWQGVVSLKNVRNIPLFIFFTFGIWLSYFFHYYLTFQCFEATSHLNLMCGLVTFIVGSIAVIVPTPNGAGPWHFAVKTMLILYGIQANDALFFVLIVHSVQTLLVVLLGIYAWIALAFTGKVKR